jgi:hypothetical protein
MTQDRTNMPQDIEQDFRNASLLAIEAEIQVALAHRLHGERSVEVGWAELELAKAKDRQLEAHFHLHTQHLPSVIQMTQEDNEVRLERLAEEYRDWQSQ